MTLDPRHIELIHLVVDGAATDEELADLDRIAADNPAVRHELEELRELCGVLDTVRAVDPPADLVREVMDNLAPAVHGGGNDGGGNDRLPGITVVAETRGHRGLLQSTYALVAGIVLGMLVYHVGFVGGPGSVRAVDVSGTLVGHDATQTETPAPSLTRLTPIDAAGTTGTATVHETVDGYTIELDLTSNATRTAMHVTLISADDNVVFRGARQTAGPAIELELRDDRIRWTQHGSRHIAAFVRILDAGLPAATDSLQLVFTVNGEPAIEVPLRLSSPA